MERSRWQSEVGNYHSGVLDTVGNVSANLTVRKPGSYRYHGSGVLEYSSQSCWIQALLNKSSVQAGAIESSSLLSLCELSTVRNSHLPEFGLRKRNDESEESSERGLERMSETLPFAFLWALAWGVRQCGESADVIQDHRGVVMRQRRRLHVHTSVEIRIGARTQRRNNKDKRRMAGFV